MEETKELQNKAIKRWTATRKMEVVLRYMRGESLNDLSRKIGIAAPQIEEWHQAAIVDFIKKKKTPSFRAR